MKQLYFKQTIGFLLLILVQHSNVYAHENKFAIYVDNSYAPYMYETDEGKADGLYPKLLKALMKNTGIEAEIHAVPWKRALLYGEAGSGAVGGAYKNSKRLESYDYSAPLYAEKLVIFVNTEKPFEFNGIDDLAGKTIGVARGWSYGQKFDDAREAKLFEVNVRADPKENFEMLSLGRIDCLILDKLAGESYAELLGIDDKVRSLKVPFSLNNGYLIIPKALEMKAFLQRLNSNLEQVRKSGLYEEIVHTFIKDTMTPSN